MAALQAGGQRVDIDHRAAGGVDQDATGFHLRQLAFADHVAGGTGLRHVQADDIGLGQQFAEAVDLGRVAQGQLVDHIEKAHLHAQGFGDHAQLHTDAAVADNAQLLAANLVGAGGGLFPDTAVGEGVFLRHAAQQ